MKSLITCLTRAVAAVAVAVAALGGTATPLQVLADGFHVSDKWLHMREPGQKAVINWDGRTETMVLSAAISADDLANFAWVIPIRSGTRPEVTAGDIDLFWILVDEFDERADTREPPQLGRGVRVIATKEIDVYDVTVLQADDADDLIEWLDEHGYRLPDGADAVVAAYLRSGSAYFVTNRIDLQNRHEAGLELARQIYRDGEQRYATLCREINAVLEGQGVSDPVCAPNRRAALVAELPGVISDAINDPANPFDLPRKWSTVLGDGLRVEEICAGTAQLVTEPDAGPLRMTRGEADAKWGTAVFDDDEFVGVVNYRRYESDPNHTPHYLPHSKTKTVVARGVGIGKKTLLLERYLDSRPDYHAVTPDDGSCAAELNAVQETLNNELGADAREHNRLHGHLYDSLRGRPAATISDSDRIDASLGLLADLQQALPARDEQALLELVRVTDDLRHGLGTPLKFVFEAEEPTYPLHISSLGRGETVIEVYFVGPTPVTDAAGLLRTDTVKEIGGALRRELAEHFAMSGAEYVTRLTYRGALERLDADARFVPASNNGAVMQTQSSRQQGPAVETADEDEKALRQRQYAVATDPNTPPGVLALVAATADAGIRFAVAENPNTAAGTLKVLANDENRIVRTGAARNRNSPPASLIELADDEDESIRFSLVGNPAAPLEALLKLARADSAKMRLTVAGHPNAPESLLQELAQDEDEEVARRARAALRDR